MSARQLQTAADDLSEVEEILVHLRQSLPNVYAAPVLPIVPHTKPRPRWSKVGDCHEISKTTGQHCKGPASYANQLCYAHWRELIGHRFAMDGRGQYCGLCACGERRVFWNYHTEGWALLKKEAEAQLKEVCPANGKSERAKDVLEYMRVLENLKRR
jgi:hypothetical protein